MFQKEKFPVLISRLHPAKNRSQMKTSSITGTENTANTANMEMRKWACVLLTEVTLINFSKYCWQIKTEAANNKPRYIQVDKFHKYVSAARHFAVHIAYEL